MDVGNMKLFVKADTTEAQAAMDRLEATLDRILEKQELVAGRMSTMLYAQEDAKRLVDIAADDVADKAGEQMRDGA